MSAAKRMPACEPMDTMNNFARLKSPALAALVVAGALFGLAPYSLAQETAPENPEAAQNLSGKNEIIAMVNGYEIRDLGSAHGLRPT